MSTGAPRRQANTVSVSRQRISDEIFAALIPAAKARGDTAVCAWRVVCCLPAGSASSLSKLLATHLVCLLALGGTVFAQATTTTTSASAEFTSVIGTVCGTGEWITVSGRAHLLQHVTQ